MRSHDRSGKHGFGMTRDAIRRYNAEGLDGLHDRPCSRQPPKLDEDQCRQLCDEVLAGPYVVPEARFQHDAFALVLREVNTTQIRDSSIALPPTSTSRSSWIKHAGTRPMT